MKVVLSEVFLKQLKKTDKSIAKKITNYLKEIETLDNPRSRGKALTNNLSGYWRYRLGSFRIVCQIKDEALIVEALYFGHRKDIYK